MTDIQTLKSPPESGPGLAFFSAVSSGDATDFHDERGSSVILQFAHLSTFATR